MRTTTHPDPVSQQSPAARLGQLRRLLASRPARAATTPSPPAGRPTVRRVWREVAPGEWRWLHVQD
jgi:hypothetical protein